MCREEGKDPTAPKFIIRIEDGIARIQCAESIDKMICDFCSEPRAFAIHLSESCEVELPKDTLKELGLEGARALSDGAWVACPECHKVILTGDRATLAKRAARRFTDKHGYPYAEMLDHCKRAHAAFWKSLTGEYYPVVLQPIDTPRRDS